MQSSKNTEENNVFTGKIQQGPPKRKVNIDC